MEDLFRGCERGWVGGGRVERGGQRRECAGEDDEACKQEPAEERDEDVVHARNGVEREEHGHVARLHAVLPRGDGGAEGGLGRWVRPVNEGDVWEM